MGVLKKSLLGRVAKVALCGLAAPGIAWAISGFPGTVDETWAPLSPYGAGKLVTVVTSSFDSVSAMAIQADGKVVLAGSCTNNFCAVRHNSDGGLDASFNGTGSVTTRLVGTSAASAAAVAMQADGKIVLGGWCAAGNPAAPRFCAVRYLTNGSLDSTFNGSGQVITNVGGFDNRGTAIAIQGDGKIVLAGWCDQSFCAVRFNADGSPDGTFNGSGKVLLLNFGRAYAVAIQADGKIVLAGSCAAGNKSCVARYTASGVLDSAFNSNGMLTSVPLGYPSAITVQADGKIVLAGGCFALFCAIRFKPDGTVDTGFDAGLAVTAITAGASGALAAAMQADGRLVLAGFCRDASAHADFCVLRYNIDGTLDSSFRGLSTPLPGTIVTPVGSLNDLAYAVAIQADGKIVVAGTCEIPTAVAGVGLAKFCTVRYEGGPFSAQNCKLDIDGDNRVLATTDSLIHARLARGMTGDAVIAGINFPAEATRKTWPAIRAYLVTQCGMNLPP